MYIVRYVITTNGYCGADGGSILHYQVFLREIPILFPKFHFVFEVLLTLF